MIFFRLWYALILLYVFITIMTDTYAANFGHGEKAPNNMLLHLLKAPWMNLDSSWENEVASTCRNDISTLFKSAQAGDMWALRMLDASSKIPSGILDGNIHDLGMYDECIGVKSHHNAAKIQGRHCMISMSMPPESVKDAAAILKVQLLSPYNPSAGIDLSLSTSVCLPTSCSVDDVAGFANASLLSTSELAEFGIKVEQVTCSSVGATENFTIGTITTMYKTDYTDIVRQSKIFTPQKSGWIKPVINFFRSFLAVLAAFLVFCTACDYVVRVKSSNASMTLRNLAKFSLYTNAIDLLSTETSGGTMPAIHGIRFLSMCSVVIGHRFVSQLVKPRVNLVYILNLRDTTFGLLIPTTLYSVDTFFLLSGFLTTHSFLRKLRSTGKLDLIEFYRHRYLRLAPVVAALILFTVFIFPHLGSGPLWETLVAAATQSCHENWWTNLLFVQNFINRKQMCLLHTWYLAVDMQLFCISPIILYPLFHRPKLGLLMLSTLLAASFIAPALQIVLMQYSFSFNFDHTFTKIRNEFFDSYTMTHNRALPYGVGMLLGYYVVNNGRKLSKAQVIFNWSFTCVALLFCIWSGARVKPVGMVYDVIWEATYVSVGRLGWSLAIAWIVYACTRGHGGPITRFCSRPIFVPFTRMSFGIYISSVVVQTGFNFTVRTAHFQTDLPQVYIFWSDLAALFAVAFILNLVIETPVSVLEKLLKGDDEKPIKIADHFLMVNKEKLAASVAEYLHLAKSRSDTESGSATMLEPDFWEIASDALNTLNKGATKTAAEWTKVWQDWESDLLRIHIPKKSASCRDAKTIKNRSARFRTETTQLESNLLFLLAAVKYGLDGNESSKRRKIRVLRNRNIRTE